MKEYKIVVINRNLAEAELNKLAKEGWEIKWISDGSDNHTVFIYTLERTVYKEINLV